MSRFIVADDTKRDKAEPDMNARVPPSTFVLMAALGW